MDIKRISKNNGLEINMKVEWYKRNGVWGASKHTVVM
jgi:hypothetical protein